jgi:hypothetical protein
MLSTSDSFQCPTHRDTYHCPHVPVIGLRGCQVIKRGVWPWTIVDYSSLETVTSLAHCRPLLCISKKRNVAWDVLFLPTFYLLLNLFSSFIRMHICRWAICNEQLINKLQLTCSDYTVLTRDNICFLYI